MVSILPLFVVVRSRLQGLAQESKSETRNPKQMRSTKRETRNEAFVESGFGISGFRGSIFVLRDLGKASSRAMFSFRGRKFFQHLPEFLVELGRLLEHRVMANAFQKDRV